MIKLGINGFGRIGRILTRLALQQKDIEIVGINDLSSPEQIAYLLKNDSVHGRLTEDVYLVPNTKEHPKGKSLRIKNHTIALFQEKNPAELPWGRLKADIIHECTGVFTEREKAALHLQAGAHRVLLSAPSTNPDTTVCMGVNTSQYDPKKHFIISNASCTTNCLAPIVKVIDDHFGIMHGTLLTVHSYTNDQSLLDLPHKDLRRARAAALSQIPTTTGAAKAIGEVIPHLKGKLDGLAIRVPTPNVSLLDFTCVLKKSASRDEVNQTLQNTSLGELQGILGYCTEPLVSIDFNGRTESGIIDAGLTQIIDEKLLKVIAWYDNETGFSARMLDLTRFIFTQKN